MDLHARCRLMAPTLKYNSHKSLKKSGFPTSLRDQDSVTKSTWTSKQATSYGVMVPFHLGFKQTLQSFCRVSHTGLNQVREWKLIGASGVGQGLLTVPTQMLVRGPYSELLRQICAQGMSCATVGSKNSRFWALPIAILATSMACIFDPYLWSRNFPLKLILAYLKSLIRR